MIEISRILCPTDFSPFAERALASAIAMARWYEAEIELLHVVPQVLPHFEAPAYPAWAALNPEAKRALLEEVKRFAAPAIEAGVHVRMDVREGDPAGEIVQEAATRPADLLVMGTHGRGGFERLVLGSVTEKALRKAPCPVLTVCRPSEATAGSQIRRILCPVDLSEASAHTLRWALSLAEEADAELALAHVVEASAEGLDAADRRHTLEADTRERLSLLVPAEARQWCRVKEIVTWGKAYEGILALARTESPQLIVMGAHGRGTLDLMLFGSTTHHVIREAACPVLTVREAVGDGRGRHSEEEVATGSLPR